MNVKNLTVIVVGAAIAVVLFASFVPLLNTASITAGEQENYTNESTYYKMAGVEDDVTISLSSGTLTLNGETFSYTSSANILLSDVFSVDSFYYEGNWLTRTWVAESTALMYPSAFSLEFSNGTVTGTYTSGGNTVTVDSPYTYLYFADTEGEYTQISGNGTFEIYANSTKDIVLSGLYYTGDSKTTYSYIDGTLSTHDYESSIAFTSEKVGLDTVKITGISVTIGDDEPFTPFRILAPATVIGHTETPESDLVGVIPLLIAVGLVIGIISAVAVGRME